MDDLSDALVALEPLRNGLKELKLNGNNIENLVNFPEFTTLEIIDLSNNRLKTITDHSFAQLTSLSHLYLSDNRLDSVDETSFDNNTNLAVLLLGSNYLKTVPSIRNLLKLKIIDVSNQNNQLKNIHGYAFERNSRPINPMNVNLGSNDIDTFDRRSFCSRNSNATEILALDVSFESMKNFNKCLLKQLTSHISPKIVLRIGLPIENVKNYTSVCTCPLRMYAAKLNVEVSGACDLSIQDKCETKHAKFNECLHVDFACL